MPAVARRWLLPPFIGRLTGLKAVPPGRRGIPVPCSLPRLKPGPLLLSEGPAVRPPSVALPPFLGPLAPTLVLPTAAATGAATVPALAPLPLLPFCTWTCRLHPDYIVQVFKVEADMSPAPIKPRGYSAPLPALPVRLRGPAVAAPIGR